jgi:hypothetical protein
MKRYYQTSALILISILFLTTACAQASPSPVPPVSQSNLQEPGFCPVQLNIVQQVTPTQTNIPTLEPFIIIAEQPPLPTITLQMRTRTPIEACTNQVELVKNLTFSDRTVLNPEQPFAKVWQIKNIGTCTWTTAYTIVFSSGDFMGNIRSAYFPQYVLPGETLDLLINLISPALPGLYTGYWLLYDETGQQFGTGPASDQPLAVVIKVSEEKVITDKSRNGKDDTDCT